MAEEKGPWEKADVILKPVGGLLTALAVALVGIIGSQVLAHRQALDAEMLDRRQAMDTDSRLYAQLMSQREDAETSLRKDMFNSIIGTFLKPKSTGYEEKVLNLELLSYNFHEALDLAPLFKSVYAQVSESQKRNADLYLKRLEDAADEVKSKQIAALEDSGGKLDSNLDLKALGLAQEGMPLIDGSLSLPITRETPDSGAQKAHFNVQALLFDKGRRRIRVALEVKTPRNGNADTKTVEVDTTYSVFWLSPFDFPMIDNTRLPHGQRCAVVIRKMGNPGAQITLVYFPGSRASLKEKPFFDEAMSDLLNTRHRIGGAMTR